MRTIAASLLAATILAGSSFMGASALPLSGPAARAHANGAEVTLVKMKKHKKMMKKTTEPKSTPDQPASPESK